jgi:hypothetical protein
MNFDQEIDKQMVKRPVNRFARRALIAAACVIIALGALVSIAATNEQNLRFDGKFNIKLMQKNAQGVFEVADEVRFDNGFNMKVSGMGRNSNVNFDLRWSGVSAKGRRVNLQVAGPGKASFDSNTGLLRVSALYKGDVDGQPTSLQVDLTTEQVTCPGGSVSGKPVKINGGVGAVELASCSRVKDAKVIAGKKAAGSGDSPSELFARTVVTGKISPVN